ncbi:hypothetical protein [Magnetospirillum sulfuroxidans]|uniref:Helix-turn-helix domain-containing protein n=1 Tax=Magnetospirillum sulfuroxidans TaxID=611300 RepID=A0ABS5IC59_9PROT|nr:hypothetical protein [Magnetospirillum sulfuroxidans]MBR9972002.1 hypothetical protein [Magnetospirillum sulfuroxidans]
MARGVNGYVTINVGVANGHSKVSAAGGWSDDERARRARRLRKDGWSYRRIAASLDMSYASVCHLLDGEEARIPLTPAPVLPIPRRPTPSTSARARAMPAAALAGSGGGGDDLGFPTSVTRMEEMAQQIVVLQQRLDTVLALNEGHRQSLARLERSMVATLQSEHRALSQRLSNAVKALLERMIPSSLRAWSGAERKTDDDQG